MCQSHKSRTSLDSRGDPAFRRMRAEHTNPKTAGMERNRRLRQELDRSLRHLNKLGALRDGRQANVGGCTQITIQPGSKKSPLRGANSAGDRDTAVLVGIQRCKRGPKGRQKGRKPQELASKLLKLLKGAELGRAH